MQTILRKGNILLKQLSTEDALMFHRLYAGAEKDSDLRGSKTPLEFTQHIISLCNQIFSIRMGDDAENIIGDCALHDWNASRREIEIGGSLLPEYWGKGIMNTAFDLLIAWAQHQYAINTILAKTEIENKNAIKFALKMGFKQIKTEGATLVLAKYLHTNIQHDF